MISLCMIVKDAEKSLNALLDSVLSTPEGAAFDEYVFVDTGSEDATRDLIVQRFAQQWQDHHKVPLVFPTHGPISGIIPWTRGRNIRLVLASFRWIDDFSAARNFSFELARGEWRAYLDADDVFPNAERLRPTIARTEREHPEVNCISMPYDYAAGELMQDKFRVVRWKDGWTWTDKIHEVLIRKPDAPRMIAKYQDLVIDHCHTTEHTRAALQRNLRICAAVKERAELAGDKIQSGKMAYYLGMYADALGEHDLCIAMCTEAADALKDLNLACASRLTAAMRCVKAGDLDSALDWAARAVTITPELPEGHAVLGIVQTMRKDFGRAARAFDTFLSTPKPALESARDVVLLDGLALGHATKAYTAVGRLEDAKRAACSIPLILRVHERVRNIFIPAFADLQKALAYQALYGLWATLVHNDEPQKAREVLKHAPEFISDLPGVADLKRKSDYRLRHLNGWEEYKACYASLNPAHYAPHAEEEFVRGLARAKRTKAWAEALPKEGPPVYVLSIGPREGTIERDVLAANPRVVVHVADASVQAEGAIEKMINDFPGRVIHHQMQSDCDWVPADMLSPNGEWRYDAVFMFEVLEHVPNDKKAAYHIRRRLKRDGTLFLSTPVSGFWANETLTREKGDPAKGHPTEDWWGHVRSNTPASLWRFFRQNGFDGRLEATECGTVFLSEMKRWRHSCSSKGNVSIYVPSTPKPFDPDSHERGHLGGSEECVVYLSAELAKLGYEVTVYSPRPDRADDRIVHARDGVLWRTPEEFDPENLSKNDSILFWRCPTLLLDARVKRSSAKKLLWLHDACYDAPKEAYEAADGVIVLSKFHAKMIEKHDGYAGPFLQAANGIDPSIVRQLTPDDDAKRDPHKVVYGASPDRGLHRLLKAWPRIREAIPDATLDIYYSWASFHEALRKYPSFREQFGEIPKLAEELKDQGVTVQGGVGHKELDQAYRTAGIYAYPHSGIAEIFCISVVKAIAAGAYVVTTPAGALPETVYEGCDAIVFTPPGMSQEEIDADPNVLAHYLDSDAGIRWFAHQCIGFMKLPIGLEMRMERSKQALDTYNWTTVAKRFSDIIEGETEK